MPLLFPLPTLPTTVQLLSFVKNDPAERRGLCCLCKITLKPKKPPHLQCVIARIIIQFNVSPLIENKVFTYLIYLDRRNS